MKPRTTLGKKLNKPHGWIYGARWADRTVEARVVRVRVGLAPNGWWCQNMMGEERSALEIKLDDQTVYVDNEDGTALAAILARKLPLPGTRFMPAFIVFDDESAKQFYKAAPDGFAS